MADLLNSIKCWVFVRCMVRLRNTKQKGKEWKSRKQRNAISFNREKTGHNCSTRTFSRIFHSRRIDLSARPFCRPKWQIFVPFHMLQLMKSLFFHIPKAWRSYLLRAQPPCIPRIEYKKCDTKNISGSKPDLYRYINFPIGRRFVKTLFRARSSVYLFCILAWM